MIKRTWCLTKLLIKSTINAAFSKSTMSNKKNSKRIGIKLLFLFLFIYVGFIMLLLTKEIVEQLIALEQETSFIGIVIALNIALCLFTTLLSSANVLYFSKDTVSILPLPFSANEIVAAKLNHLLATELISEVCLGILPLCMYGYMTKASALFYILMIFVMLFVPIVPILLSSLIVMVLMAFTKTFKNKSLIQTIVIVASMFVGFGVSMVLNNLNPEDPTEVLVLLLKAGAFVQIFYRIFPTVSLAVITLTDLNAIPLLFLAIVSICAYVLVVMFAKPLYFRGVIGSMFSGNKSNKLVNSNDYKNTNIARSYILKEFRCLIRKPIFFTQCVLPYFLIPVLIVASTALGFNSSDSGLKINQIGAAISQIDNANKYVFIVCELILLFLSFYSFSGVTNITRDGHNAIFMKYIPLSFSRQLFYKAIPSYLLTIIPNVIVVILVGIFLKIEITPIILASILFLIIEISQSLFGVVFDALKPKLNWSNEYQAVKNNLNMFIVPVISTLLAVPFILVLIFGSNIAYSLVVLGSFIIYIILAAIMILIVVIKDEKLAVNIY